jgi:hypothetical protein
MRKGYIIKKLTFHPDGRMHVGLWRNQEQISAKVHRLVLEAFVGKCPKGKEGSHINGDCRDNRLENLIWETPKENHARMVGHGTKITGERSYLHKLSEEQVRKIKLLYGRISAYECGDIFNVTPSNISAIWRGKSWKHITTGGME